MDVKKNVVFSTKECVFVHLHHFFPAHFNGPIPSPPIFHHQNLWCPLFPRSKEALKRPPRHARVQQHLEPVDAVQFLQRLNQSPRTTTSSEELWVNEFLDAGDVDNELWGLWSPRLLWVWNRFLEKSEKKGGVWENELRSEGCLP